MIRDDQVCDILDLAKALIVSGFSENNYKNQDVLDLCLAWVSNSARIAKLEAFIKSTNLVAVETK